MQRIFVSLFAVALVAIGSFSFVGCTDEDPGSSDVVVAKAGSTYNYSGYSTSEFDGTVDSVPSTMVATVIANDVSIGGKTGVLQVREITQAMYEGVMSYDTSESLIKFEENNDISVYLNLADMSDDEGGMGLPVDTTESVWLKIPYGSKTAITETLVDTTIYDEDLMTNLPVKMTVTTSYVGEETATVSGTSLKIWVGKAKMDITMSGISIGTVEQMIYFAPEIGYVYKYNVVSTFDFFGLGANSTDQKVLTGYTLK